MKKIYTFANGDTSEIEVSEEWANILEEHEKEETNNEKKETRRHCSLEAYNLDDNLIPSKYNLEEEVLNNEKSDFIISFINSLTSKKRELFIKLFIIEIPVVDIANEEGVVPTAISNKKKRLKEKMKNHYLQQQIK